MEDHYFQCPSQRSVFRPFQIGQGVLIGDQRRSLWLDKPRRRNAKQLDGYDIHPTHSNKLEVVDLMSKQQSMLE